MAKKPRELAWNNVETYSIDEMLAALEPILLRKVPEGIRDQPATVEANVMLGWIANQYSYVESMHNRMAALTSQLSDDRTDPDYKRYVQQRDALERIAAALKMKYQAVSRMLTVLYGGEGDSRVGGHGGWGSIPSRQK